MDKLITGYSITTDPHFLDEMNAITPELSKKMEGFHKMAMQGRKSSIRKLQKAIEKYPKNPLLKNYLSVLYSMLGDTQKMYEVNRWIVTEHPDYLFGKLNLANEYFYNQEYDKMPEVLGDAMDIKFLFPERDTFHLNEVVSFMKCAVLYFTATKNLEQAEIRYDIMQELDPDSADTEIAMKHIVMARMDAAITRYKEEEKTKIRVETKSQEINDIIEAPEFHHQEIEWLYTHGLYIGKEKLDKILSLPRASLISDLELVLQDSIDRYGFFYLFFPDNDWDEEKSNFVVHALSLLGELEAVESLESIFNLLSQSDEFLSLYLGDFLTSYIWEPIYKIVNNNLEVCKKFMFKPGIDTYARTIFPEIVEQVAIHNPKRKEEAINWFNEIFEFFLNSKLEDNVIDSELNGLMVWMALDFNGFELMPIIQQLYEKGLVAKGVCGDWDAVSQAFEQAVKRDKKREILSIAESYKNITSTWPGYNEKETETKIGFKDYDIDPFDPFDPKQPIVAEAKIGRNDPCPCGSGKKYKKCCWNFAV